MSFTSNIEVKCVWANKLMKLCQSCICCLFVLIKKIIFLRKTTSVKWNNICRISAAMSFCEKPKNPDFEIPSEDYSKLPSRTLLKISTIFEENEKPIVSINSWGKEPSRHDINRQHESLLKCSKDEWNRDFFWGKVSCRTECLESCYNVSSVVKIL